jgi:hypothetical protein
MIREPKVGMRVQVSEESGWLRGEKGTIVTADGSDQPEVKPDSGLSKWVCSRHLTEIKENGMKKGDLVKTKDGSYCVRVDKFQEDKDYIGMSTENFEVVGFTYDDLCTASIYGNKTKVHDIYIKSTLTGKVYLHSSCMLAAVTPKPKEKQYCEYCGKKLD